MYTTRFAIEQDIPTIVDMWTKMTIEMSCDNGTPLPTEQRIAEVNELFQTKMRDRELIFRVAIDEQCNIAACAGGLLRKDFVWPLSVEAEFVGWVVSVYTHVNDRKQGLAARIVTEVADWLKAQNVTIIRLWASQHGKPTYEKLGFVQTTFMEKYMN